MTENEAIEFLKSRCLGLQCEYHIKGRCKDNYVTKEKRMDDTLSLAEKALEEIQQYRAIGTIEECREAVEKQKVKKVIAYGDSEDGDILCPYCDDDLWDYKECGFNNCPFCGQRLDWSVE